MINERDLAELVVKYTLDDPITFHRLAQVSKRFNAETKRHLIRKEEIIGLGKCKRVWTELPNGGQKHGLRRAWNLDSGQLLYEENLSLNKVNGLCREWHSNGQLKHKYNYLNGVPHGIWQEWYANGEIWFEHNYTYGLGNGLSRVWYMNMNHQLLYEGNYVNGQNHGFVREWHENGQLKYEKNYVNGQLIENN